MNRAKHSKVINYFENDRIYIESVKPSIVEDFISKLRRYNGLPVNEMSVPSGEEDIKSFR